MSEQMTGAQSLIRSLEAAGVDTVFGIPGGAVLPAYDPLLDSQQIRHVLVRHEQGAGHAAEGYARSTGRPVRPRRGLADATDRSTRPHWRRAAKARSSSAVDGSVFRNPLASAASMTVSR